MRLFVISDLHLGGRPHTDAGPMGSQICHSYTELTAFIDWVRNQANAPSSVELVLNGDIVDFLMEDDHGEGNPASPWLPDQKLVIEKLKSIIMRTREEGNYGPFDAMAALLNDGQHLTFILGNHDIELSLPAVRHFLEEQLGGGVRFRFIYDGEAYVRGDLLIEHGNRYDSWNIIDHSALREARSLMSRGMGARINQSPEAFVPPPGSFMVINVINKIKSSYRFVDLLKPESAAVLPILLALHPRLEHALAATLQAYSQSSNKFVSPAQPKHSGQLSTDEQASIPSLAGDLRHVLGAAAATKFPVQPTGYGELSAAESVANLLELSKNIRDYITDAAGVFSEKTAGARDELLRIGFDTWRGKLACNETREVSPYREAAEELAKEGKFNCVIFGHTHLPKREIMDVDNRSVVYINTGTWTDTMHIPYELLEPTPAARARFRVFISDLKNNKLSDYLERRLSFADITLNSDRVVSATLNQFTMSK